MWFIQVPSQQPKNRMSQGLLVTPGLEPDAKCNVTCNAHRDTCQVRGWECERRQGTPTYRKMILVRSITAAHEESTLSTAEVSDHAEACSFSVDYQTEPKEQACTDTANPKNLKHSTLISSSAELGNYFPARPRMWGSPILLRTPPWHGSYHVRMPM